MDKRPKVTEHETFDLGLARVHQLAPFVEKALAVLDQVHTHRLHLCQREIVDDGRALHDFGKDAREVHSRPKRCRRGFDLGLVPRERRLGFCDALSDEEGK